MKRKINITFKIFIIMFIIISIDNISCGGYLNISNEDQIIMFLLQKIVPNITKQVVIT